MSMHSRILNCRASASLAFPHDLAGEAPALQQRDI